ncbi:hypothetical protein EAH80_29345 [Mycobacterium hodleri]|uniref:Uncharacterized protein n=2 Tax=Mycolicibacterium hodleri TaxID=49897 RepID=A0A502DPV4_9MYCO|nr:hypothetical protein EAH80_29345 [Mycolicibacterium hodleri]
MAKELLHMATGDKVSDAVKLNAIRDALDRAGLKPGIEIEVTAKPVDQIIDQIGPMQGGSRDAYRRGIADGTDTGSDQHTPALVISDEPVDAEVVDDFDVYAPLRNQQHGVHTVTSDGDAWPPAPRTAPGAEDVDDSLDPFATSGPPTDTMMSIEDAVAVEAKHRRRIVAERQADAAVAREAYQRERADRFGLPPGRSG